MRSRLLPILTSILTGLALYLSACTGPDPTSAPPRPEPPAAAQPPDPEPPTPPEPDPPPPPDLVVDLHTDTVLQVLRRDVPLDAEQGLEAGIVQLREGGFNAVVYALWPGKKPQASAEALRLLETAHQQIERLESVELATSPRELEAIHRRGHFAVILGLEGAHGLDPGGIETLHTLYAGGVRVLGATWSFTTPYLGSSGDGGGGVTEAGWALLEHAQDLGMVIDLSHASDTATLEICRRARAPVMASHSGVDGVHPHTRNLTDEAVRCIAAGGGVVGVNLHRSFLGGAADLAQVVAHVEHLSRVGGVETAAIGTDFDGYIRPPQELPDASHLPVLCRALAEGGMSEAAMAGFRGENFRRVWRAAWKARDPQVVESVLGADPEDPRPSG